MTMMMMTMIMMTMMMMTMVMMMMMMIMMMMGMMMAAEFIWKLCAEVQYARSQSCQQILDIQMIVIYI